MTDCKHALKVSFIDFRDDPGAILHRVQRMQDDGAVNVD